ncbi:pentatricopeptide repeat-containing protein [Pyrus ussuriensis x Pyrus communis]|uniref:Pentatricopeptide repeat-containing protein n=1 Tax=Pyrus ussuriensis x Pyrus communis TaxID=2448454 RepID=A0A5N5FTT0_9ROSA|nr:pentatricopeptide repeat-containing protein [Pyrus ussuriensis x Pyrus communis]
MSLPAYTATPIQLPQLPKQPPPFLPLPNPSQSTSPNPNQYRKHTVSLERTKTPIDPTVSWTSSISHRCRNGHLAEALAHFIQMRQAGVEPNHVTFLAGVEPDYVTIIAVIAACADLGTLGLGLWLNCFVMKRDFKDNVRITLEFFNLMQKKGLKPDGVSFTGALTACSHAGLVDEGLHYFDNMKGVHRITPRIEHYGCIVDLYSRAGRLEDALGVIENMPMKPNEVVLGSLLAACRTIGNISLAERLMKYLSEVDPGVDSNYVLLANIYAAAGRWDGANKVRKKMKDLGVQKTPGCKLLSFELILCGYVPENIVREPYKFD